MILKASERGHARALSLHLLNADQNEHVDVHEIRGLASSNLHAAFQEIDAASMGTQCKKPFFHVQFSPPATANLSIEQYERAVEAVEKKMGLVGHPRAIIFHEKEGRRHAHAVWSRLHVKEVKRVSKTTGKTKTHSKLVARQLPHFKIKLNELSLALFYENGLEPPKGLVDKNKRDPNNYDLNVWQQAGRLKEDPRDLKQIIRTALEAASSRSEFEKNLKDHGLYLAQGDRRNFLVVHHGGEPMSLTRYSGMKGKVIAQRIGVAENLPTLEQVQEQIRQQQSRSVKERLDDLKSRQQKEERPLLTEKKAMTHNHRDERAGLKAHQKQRREREALIRAGRLRKGIAGLWDRVSGRRGRVSRQNYEEIRECRQRDREERQALVTRQLEERQELQRRIEKLKIAHEAERKPLVMELGHSVRIVDKALTNRFNDRAEDKPHSRSRKSIKGAFDDSAGQGKEEGKKEKLSGEFNRQGKEEKKVESRKNGRGRTRKHDPH